MFAFPRQTSNENTHLNISWPGLHFSKVFPFNSRALIFLACWWIFLSFSLHLSLPSPWRVRSLQSLPNAASWVLGLNVCTSIPKLIFFSPYSLQPGLFNDHLIPVILKALGSCVIGIGTSHYPQLLHELPTGVLASCKISYVIEHFLLSFLPASLLLSAFARNEGPLIIDTFVLDDSSLGASLTYADFSS